MIDFIRYIHYGLATQGLDANIMARSGRDTLLKDKKDLKQEEDDEEETN